MSVNSLRFLLLPVSKPAAFPNCKEERIYFTVKGFQKSKKVRRQRSEIDKINYYIPITDTTLELSVFWPSDTESRINELRFSESISLSFKTRLTSVTCFCGDVT